MSSKQNNIKPNAPKVSVGIPVYNAECYIELAIESVLSQTFADFELIISDDRSTDGTEKIIRSFQDPRIRYIKNEDNKFKAPGNFNNCIDHSRGEYVYIFHADDLMFPNNIEKKVKVLDDYPNVGMVHSNIFQIDKSGNVLDTHWAKKYADDYVIPGREYFGQLFREGNLVCAPSVLMRKKCYETFGGFDLELPHACDWEMWLRTSLFYDVAYLTEPLVGYRFHEAMDTNNYKGGIGGLEQNFSARMTLLRKYPNKIENVKNLKRDITSWAVKWATSKIYDLFDSNHYTEAEEYLMFILKISPSSFFDSRIMRLLIKFLLGNKAVSRIRKLKTSSRVSHE